MQQLGRYEVLEELGHGAMGTVYRARDPKIERVVAIKTVRVIGTTPEQETEYRRRFFREAQAAGKLSHPGIVTIHDVGEDEATQTPYIVMEYVEGRTLESLLTDPGLEPRSLNASLELIKQVAEALDYAHTYSIVHRDIKPANIRVTAEGRAKITDFGIAKLTQSEFTVPGQILGTPAYLSPEQLKGIPIDGRSDLFALGVILYWMLTGQKPFAGDTSTVLYKVACEDPPPVTQLNPALPPELDRVVSGALAKDPASRYQRGKELADDLDDLLHGRVPRRAGGVLPPAALERTLIEPRPAVPVEKRVEKTVVEPPPLVSGTAGTPQRKLAAIMFTDMMGYSALTQKNEALALELLQGKRRLLRPIFSKHEGKEIKTIGDAFLVEFASSVRAAHCAVEMQKVLADHNSAAPPERQIRIRIGLHVGDVVHEENDVFGDAVNIASRIEPLAPPGGICVSEDVARQIQNKIELPVLKLGKGELKNIQLPVDIYRIVLPWERRGLPFSGPFVFRLRQKRTVAWAAGILVLLLLLAGVGWWWSEKSPPAPSQSPTATQRAPAKARGVSRTAGGRGNRNQQSKEEEKERREEEKERQEEGI